MRKVLFLLVTAMTISVAASAQCTTTNATSCVCPPGGGTDCDLLPDIKASADALVNGYTVYTQTGNTASGSQGSNDGRLRLNGTTPNIGYGPLDTRAINKWLCGTDTLLTNPGALCPDGRVPKRFVNQRIFHKNGNTMSYTDVPCGTLTYHSSHGHMHVDNWGIYTLRIMNPNDPNPLNWSIVGTGTKLAFCLLDIGSCTNAPTYCRDDNNNPLTTAQIPNYTIGNGGYGCSSTLQGISNGYYDTYSQSLDGMWIDIPPGTCNGQYYIVIQIDPNRNMRELNENNNVIAVPVNITNQSPAGSPVVNISANKPGTILSDALITLTATAGTSYLWSPGGQTSQSITVNSAGSYTCTVTNYCGTGTSAPFVLSVLPAAPTPVSSGTSICSGSTATLTATNGGNGTLKWYNSDVATTPLVTGASYTTPTLNNTTTYYVENEVTTAGAITHVGPLNNTLGAGAYQTTAPATTWYEQFDAVSDFTLVSVKVYASVAGNRTFILQDRASTVLRSQSIPVPAVGENVITLNWFVPAGPGYKLLVSGTPNLYYNTSGVTYPYTAPGICNIFGSYSGHSNYTFFYDFVVKSPDLVAKSGRVPVTVNVTSVTVFLSALPPSLCVGQSTTISASGATSYLWNPGGATTSSISVSPAGTTVYSVTGTLSGCSDTETITIDVNPIPTVSASDVSGCSGSPVALTGSPAGGTWSVANPYTGPGTTYTYSYTDAFGCSATSSPATITINSLPAVSAGNVSGCEGTSIALMGTPAGGTWSLPNPYSGLSTSYTYSYTDGNGCTNTSSSSTITVNPLPVVTSGNVSGCDGSPISLMGSPAGGSWDQPNPYTGPGTSYSYSYTNALGCTNTSTSTITVNPIPVVTADNISGCDGSPLALSGSPAGGTWSVANPYSGPSTTYTHTYTDANGCTNTSSIAGITINSLPVVTAGNVSGCAGSSINLTGSPAGGSWSQSNPYSGPSTTYTYSFTDANGCSNTSAPADVTVNPLPVVTAGNVSGCAGSSIALMGSPAGGNWSQPNPYAGPSTTYSYSYTDANGCSNTSASSTITTNANPTPVISGSLSFCAGSSTTLNAGGGYSSYSWSNGSSSQTINVNSSGTFSVTVTDANNCIGSTSANTTVNPLPSVSYSGLASTYDVNAAPATLTGAPSGGTFSGPGVSGSTFTPSAAGIGGPYNITYNYTDANGCSNSFTQQTTVTGCQAPAQPGIITGPSSVCANQNNVNYSVAAVAGATSYTWTLPPGTVIKAGLGTRKIRVRFGSSAGNITVKANNSCGSSPIRSMAIAMPCREIEANVSESFVTVFPNPSTTEFTLMVNSEIESYSVRIFDIAGRLVVSHENLSSDLKFTWGSNLTAGIYFAEVISGESREVIKLVKQGN